MRAWFPDRLCAQWRRALVAVKERCQKGQYTVSDSVEPGRVLDMDFASTLSIAPMEDDDIASVIALWERCGLTRPWNDAAADIALARRDGTAAVLVGRDGDRIVASVMVGHDGHRGWVYYVS